MPTDLVVVGGGYIGIELGTAYAQLGANVTVVEATDRILREFDDDLVAVVTKRLGALGVDVRTSALVVGDDGANILVERGGDTDKIPASTCWSPSGAGRTPTTCSSRTPASCPPTTG